MIQRIQPHLSAQQISNKPQESKNDLSKSVEIRCMCVGEEGKRDRDKDHFKVSIIICSRQDLITQCFSLSGLDSDVLCEETLHTNPHKNNVIN